MISIVQPLEHHGARVLIPAEIFADFESAGVKRIICTINGKRKLHAAFHKRNGETFVMLGKQMAKDFDLIPGDEIDVTIEADKTRYQMAVSEEFLEVLATDVDGEKLFHQLTPGKQRSLLHAINMVKSSNIRIEKALLLMQKLKMGQTDLKLLFKK